MRRARTAGAGGVIVLSLTGAGHKRTLARPAGVCKQRGRLASAAVNEFALVLNGE
jgi:hypothetical protein